MELEVEKSPARTDHQIYTNNQICVECVVSVCAVVDNRIRRDSHLWYAIH